MLQKIREFGEKGGHFGAGIREKGGEIWILEHEYVPFLGPSGGAGSFSCHDAGKCRIVTQCV